MVCAKLEDRGDRPLIERMRLSPCIADKYEHLSYALERVGITGLYLEFGVFSGDSINFIADSISPQIIYGFDSFTGLPEEWVRRKDGSLTFLAGTFAVETVPVVRQNVRLIQGWFEDSLPRFMDEHSENIAFINIDSDIYRSAKTILTDLNRQIIPGTILYFDEITGWGDLIAQYDMWEEGEYKALLEWLSEFNRRVEPVSRNNRYGAAVRVVL
jgi:macrocin-O-methyltransferase TylF-like protien